MQTQLASGREMQTQLASSREMRAQLASGSILNLQRVKVLEALWQAHEQKVEERQRMERELWMQDTLQKTQEREAAYRQELDQEKRWEAQVEQHLWECAEQTKVLRQTIQSLREEQEEQLLESAWQQQHQMELEAPRVPGTVLPELVEAQLEKKERARRRGLAFWMQTICLVVVCLMLITEFVLGAAVLYARSYDPELFYRLLPRVLPQPTYDQLAYFASRTLPVDTTRLLPL
ncbi:trichohyalin-like [Numida meleagris]|uniref:trichohyalin-like n=1 Tax=Numida meleagris TaxID=8996 RepID=UPI000B3E3F96|nr:trichohyalin-like [Numida meleagris]